MMEGMNFDTIITNTREEVLRSINRHECIKMYAILIGKYNEYVRAFATTKHENKLVYAHPIRHKEFVGTYLRKIKTLCGRFYYDGENPRNYPHPVWMAMRIKFAPGFVDKEASAANCSIEMNELRETMKKFGMV